MIPTWIGMVVALLGVMILVRGSVSAMLVLLLMCSLMPGSAALALPALGGSTIPPVHFALGFMLLRLLIGEPRFDLLRLAFFLNIAFLIYAAYAAVVAYVGPRMFQGDMYVIPMKLAASGPGLHAVSLAPSAQNITSAIYLIGTLLLSVFVSAAVLHKDGLRRFVAAASAVGLIMVFLGFTGSIFAGTAWTDILDLFRNGNYAQTEQNFGELSRIKGISPEPSTYAMSALAWFIFLFECWSRDVRPRLTGFAALALAAALVFSTSSTAYLGLGAYGVIFALRAFLVTGSVPARKMLVLGGVGFVGFLGVVAAALALPDFAALFVKMFDSMTVGKAGSDSALERSQWAAQGMAAFIESYGIGVGPGSFRSSSFITAILGTTGVIGIAAFALHIIKVLKPLRPSTYLPAHDAVTAVGVAASWAAFIILIPNAFIAPSGDPGPEFGIMAGAALALRWRAAMALREQQVLPAFGATTGRLAPSFQTAPAVSRA